MCVSDFINTLLMDTKDMNKTWIGMKIQNSEASWIDSSTVNYINFNPLLLGMHKVVAFHVSKLLQLISLLGAPHI